MAFQQILRKPGFRWRKDDKVRAQTFPGNRPGQVPLAQRGTLTGCELENHHLRPSLIFFTTQMRTMVLEYLPT